MVVFVVLGCRGVCHKFLESRNFTELGDGDNEEDEWDRAAAVDDEEAITGDGGGKKIMH